MFKKKFKYYKKKCPPPDLNSVIGFSSCLKYSDKVTSRRVFELSEEEEQKLPDLGLKPSPTWQIYELNNCPGLIYILNPFSEEGQLFWAHKCLDDYTKPPNKLNLHAHGDLKENEHWWHICNTNLERKNIIYKKLRWSTLGYHHDWESKVYSEAKSEFPEELAAVCRLVCRAAGGWNVTPEAAIINYYHPGSTLSGHTDHSEPNSEVPLVSLSFGQEAVFLVGGHSLEDDCEALLVHSGDVIVMSGQSRLCYHGVPLVALSPATPWLSRDSADLPSFHSVQDYLSSSRININVRQVY